MNWFRSVIQHPLAIFSILTLGFLGWLVTDASTPATPPPIPQAVGDLMPDLAEVRLREIGNALRRVHEGMSRAEVEAQVGRPAPHDIRPVERSNGRVVYRTHYVAHLLVPLPSVPGVEGRCEAILEYDASAPGHPLIRITAVAVPRRGPRDLPALAAV